MKNSLYILFLLLPALTHAVVGEKARPEILKHQISQAFERLIKSDHPNSWTFDGSRFYGLLDFNEKLILNTLAETPDKSDIFIVDVGAAKGGWANEAQNYILNQNFNGKHFHIVSLTGGKELESKIETIKNVTQYRFNYFEIENILTKLPEILGFDLVGKVDLVISNWTLRHLVDPFGTLEDLYSLLAVNGMLMTNDFSFLLSTEGDSVQNMQKFWKILSGSNANFFLKESFDHNEGAHIFLERPNSLPLGLPLSYTERSLLPPSFDLTPSLLLGSRTAKIFGQNNVSGVITTYQLTPHINAEEEKWEYGVSFYFGKIGSKSVFERFQSFYDTTEIFEI